jgi:hypothetical protein
MEGVVFDLWKYFSKISHWRNYCVELRVNTLYLRRFAALPKIVQADYQPRRLQDKTAQLQLYTGLLLHGRNQSRITLSWVVLQYHSNWYYNINLWINGTTISSVLILQYQSIMVLRYHSYMVTKTILKSKGIMILWSFLIWRN